MPRAPKFWPTNPKFCGEFEYELRSGFRSRNGELKGSGVSGTEGDNSPFRGARTKLTSYFGFPVPETPLHTFLGTRGYFWAGLPNRTGFQPEQQLRPGPKYCSVKLKNFDFRGGEINFFLKMANGEIKIFFVDLSNEKSQTHSRI